MWNSFEGGNRLESADIEHIHEKALDALERSRINERDFLEPHGPYTAESVERDIAYVDRQEKHFNERMGAENAHNKMVADIFEAIVLEHGELSNWFGENATTIKTSKYDDYENGVDAVIEFRNPESNSASFLGLAADVTFAADSAKKFERIKKQIEKGSLARVKYFHSELMNMHGQLSKLPEVIIGADKRTVLELAELWIEREAKALATHRIQIMILTQMSAQLEVFALFADHIDKPDIGLIYRERKEVIDGILAEKADFAASAAAHLEEDNVHRYIMSLLSGWKRDIESGIGSKTA